MLSGTDDNQLAGCTQEDFSPEKEAELLASNKEDTEDMDVEPKDDNFQPAAASESFCCAISSVRDPTSPRLRQPPLLRTHNAILVARLALMSGRSFNTGITSPLPPIGSLAEEEDHDRPSLSFMIHSFATNRNICSSFDTTSLICLTCNYKPEHNVLSGYKDVGPSKYSCPAVFVLADQSFAPASPLAVKANASRF